MTRIALAVTALLASLGPLVRNAAGQPPAPPSFTDQRGVPDTPAGRRGREILNVINANDPAAVAAYVGEHFAPELRDSMPTEEHQAIFAQIYDESRGFDLYGTRVFEGQPANDYEIVMVVVNRLTDAWESIMVQVAPEPPHHITGLNFAPAPPPRDAPRKQPPGTDAEVVQELEAYLNKMAAADVFSGAVLLARNGAVLFERAYGQASKRYGVPNRNDTLFNLGSMNKMFTAVAVAQLAQQGKLSFDDPAGKHLDPDWLPDGIADRVTIHQLLTHTSGLGSYFNEEFMTTSRALFREIIDYKPLLETETLAFEPGTQWAYSNTGYLLLGAIIEKVSGQNYFDYIREHVYKPAGMMRSDSYEMDQPVPNLAMGYIKYITPKGVRWTNNLFEHVIRGGPAGGGFSTVGELLLFDQALRSHKLLDAEHTRRVLSAKPPVSPHYGYGFNVEDRPGARIAGHGGGFPGISTNLDMYLDSGYTAVVLSNCDRGAHVINTKIRELLGAGP